MKMKLKPAFRYQFSSLFKGMAVIYLSLVLIISMFIIGTLYMSNDTTFSSNFNGYGITATIFLFVIGIINIRSDLRLGLQYGVSRRTVFVSEILTVLAASVILAAAGELLGGIVQALSADNHKFVMTDLYQDIYLESGKMTITFGQHVLSAMVNASLMLSSCLLGMFFSLLFWRLSKVWTIIVAISMPILINCIPYILIKMGVDLTPFINWIVSSPLCLVLFCLLLTTLFVIIDWLLLRRINIREAK